MSRQISAFLSTMSRPFYEFIYPPTCFVCEELLTKNEKKVCGSCWGSIKQISITDQLLQEMKQRLTSGGVIDDLFAGYHFEKMGVLQDLIHQLKYAGMWSIGVELGKRIGTAMVSAHPELDVDGVIAVPLHRVKERERGYNQSEYICRGISEATGWRHISGALRRTRYTDSQTALGIDARRENISNAFVISKKYSRLIAGKRYVIVDDVITTGATIEECCRVLKNQNVRSLVVCSVGLADHSQLP